MIDYVKVLEEYIDESKLKIPSLEGKTFEDVMSKLIADKESFSQMLCMLSILVGGRYITLLDDLAEASIRYKIEKKAFLLNITLDILFYLEFISYEKVTKDCILIKILNEDLANELNTMRIKMKEHSDKYKRTVEAVDKFYSDNPKYQEIKKKLQ